MTQVKRAQDQPKKLALRTRADARTLAQKRAAFAAQMRAMAVDDLKAVSERLKGLHEELEKLDARVWTQQELAQKMGIPYRTFQSWENGEVENQDGKGYDKMARFYSRKLGRKISRKWIVFGGDKAGEPKGKTSGKPKPISAQAADGKFAKEVADLREEVGGVAAEIEGMAGLLQTLATDLKSVQDDLAILKRRKAG